MRLEPGRGALLAALALLVTSIPNQALLGQDNGAGDGGRWVVSTGGGTEPVWAHSGRELFYRNGRQDLVAVAVLPGEAFTMGEQRTLFSAQPYLAAVFRRMYDITPNDQRFVMIRLQAEGGRDDAQLIVVENFFEELKAKVGN